MAEPISPFTVFMGDRDICEYEAKVEKAVKDINAALKAHLIKNEIPRADSTVCVDVINDHAVVLEVVYRFRKAGWDVSYQSNGKKPFVSVGIRR
jgi:hypothetical protein